MKNFKIGDKVKYIGNNKGFFGVTGKVISICGYKYQVCTCKLDRNKDNGNGVFCFYSNSLSLIDPKNQQNHPLTNIFK